MAGITVTLGNTSIVEAHDIAFDPDGRAVDGVPTAEDTPRRVRVPRPDLGEQETRFDIPEDFGAAEALEAIAGSPEHDAKMHALPEAQQRFYLHLLAIEDAWWSAHSSAFPAWVEVEGDDVEDLAALLADHFSTAKHTCDLGRPEAWEPSPTPDDRAAASAAALATALEEIGAA